MRVLEGVVTALVTPFRDGDVDFDALQRLLERQLKGGIEWILLCGTTGESPSLKRDERVELVRFAKEFCGERASIMANVGTNDTDTSVAYAQDAAEAGADALLAVVPFYNKPNPEGLFRHFVALAEATTLPLALYNVPSRVGMELPVDVVSRLSGVDNIVALKEASPDLERISAIKESSNITLLSGNDSLALASYALGAVGVVSVASNIVPSDVRAIWEHYKAGDVDGALAAHQRLFPLMKALFVETNPVPVKAALSILKVCTDEVRLPLHPASETTRLHLEKVLRNLQLLE